MGEIEIGPRGIVSDVITSKSEISAFVAAGKVHECFVHEELGSFDISLMRKAARNNRYGRPYRAALYPENGHQVAALYRGRDVDLNRVWELMLRPDAPWLNDPLIVVYIPKDKSHLVCDGSHRLIARWLLKMPNFSFYMVHLTKAIRVANNMAQANVDYGRLDMRSGKPVYRR